MTWDRLKASSRILVIIARSTGSSPRAREATQSSADTREDASHPRCRSAGTRPAEKPERREKCSIGMPAGILWSMQVTQGAQRLLGLGAEAGLRLARATSCGRLQPALDLAVQALRDLGPLRGEVVLLGRVLGEVEQLEEGARRRRVLDELEGRQPDARHQSVLDDRYVQIVGPIRLAAGEAEGGTRPGLHVP